jgi:hypothetical protein
LAINGRVYYLAHAIALGKVYLRQHVLPTYLHKGFEVSGGVRSIEGPYHGHPYQPKAEVDHCQNKSGLAYKAPYHEHR